ncbi:MAG: hypothetical protein HWN66_00985 [Candidatus Helarchaeota archaeon]|nr:hypothetical protein [Candidatus Helarchaeota archaeon]
MLLVAAIAAVLFLHQAIFSFLLWRRGEKKYLLRFIIYSIAAGGLVILTLGFLSIPFGGSGRLYFGSMYLLGILGAVATGLTIYLFIRELWLSKEETT